MQSTQDLLTIHIHETDYLDFSFKAGLENSITQSEIP